MNSVATHPKMSDADQGDKQRCIESVSMPIRVRNGRFMITMILMLASAFTSVVGDELPELKEASTVSPLDSEVQKLLYWAPETAKNSATPVFIFLHSWSSDYQQDNSKWLSECVRHEWIWIHPDFRGINQTPKACGSKFARQDILDALQFARQQWNIDNERVYIAGVSGGGHMSLLMAGHHPDQFSAVSSWVGPMDLAEWHRFHTKDGKPQKYAQMIEASFGGPPGTAKEIDDDYRDRSPLFQLSNTGTLPISIWAGVQDGHTGSVPISHSLKSFNAIAKAHGDSEVTDEEIHSLLVDRKLSHPTASDLVKDDTLKRIIHLRRNSGQSMVTIFEGGHESIPEAAFAWLKTRRRMVTFKKP